MQAHRVSHCVSWDDLNEQSNADELRSFSSGSNHARYYRETNHERHFRHIANYSKLRLLQTSALIARMLELISK